MAFGGVFRRTRHAIDVEALIRVMVLNRLCDPESKLGVLRWVPPSSTRSPTFQRFLERAANQINDLEQSHRNTVVAMLR